MNQQEIDNLKYEVEDALDHCDSADNYADDAQVSIQAAMASLRDIKSQIASMAKRRPTDEEISEKLKGCLKEELEAAGKRILAHMDDWLDNYGD